MIQFDTIDYLRSGDARQRQAYEVLTSYAVLDCLTEFTPVLTGTIPLQIYVETSDLDISCYWQKKADFLSTLQKCFGPYEGFAVRELHLAGSETIIANFFLQDFEVEVFGQNRPSKEQHAYRHMLIEYQILSVKGEEFREQVIALKKQGYKTEPAFAKLLGLAGDPYKALLQVSLDDLP
ncbi:DUF4269 domain-containing protein [Rufibacter immobilis]|uniref:DUF4269 domain-containing protein n=1 Tax=Rufibacter immobilis TaxID=1348778 RepID=UPI0035E732CB